MFYGSFFVSDPFPLLLVVPVFQIRFCFIFTGHLRVFFCYLIFLTYCLFGSGFNLSAYAPVSQLSPRFSIWPFHSRHRLIIHIFILVFTTITVYAETARV